MTVSVPSSAKVYTTKYENFRGVDYTNDASNVWRRRSPSGKNMLPDDSGVPFTRTGFETMITTADLKAEFERAKKIDDTIIVPEYITINRCFYFELAGFDHIMIFANGGIFRYMKDELSFVFESDDIDCYESIDRAFFFEGNGKSAFYIYGNHKVWVYEYEDGNYRLRQSEVYVPVILISTAPSTCGGTVYEGYNLLGDKATVQYIGNDMFHHYTTGSINYSIDKDVFVSKVSSKAVYEFVYSGSAWEYNGSTISLTDYGLSVVGTPINGNKIVVIYSYGVLLPTNVSQSRISDVECYISSARQFDTKLEVASKDGTPTSTRCVLKTDLESMPEQDRRAYILFGDSYTPVVDGEDCISVTFPVTEVTTTDVTNEVPVSINVSVDNMIGGDS